MKRFLIALQFLTIIKIFNVTMKEEDFGRSSVYFPLIGAVIGGILYLFNYVGEYFFQHFTVVVIILSLEIWLTGGIHLDGLMDTCDGIFSGRKRSKMLDIMKDSRVGAMGVLGLFITLLLKLSFLLEIPESSFYVVILFMPIIGRWCMVCVLHTYNTAREDGMGAFFQRYTHINNFLFLSIYSTILAIAILPNKYLLAVPLTGLCVYLISKKITRILGGHTGDTFGAINEWAEVFFILWCGLLEKI